MRSRLAEIQLMVESLTPWVMTMLKVADLPRSYLGGRLRWCIRPHKNAYIHGIGLAVREDIPHKVVQLDTDLEACAITIQFSTELAVVSIYMASRDRIGKESHFIGKLQDLVAQLLAPYVILVNINANHP